MHTGSSPISKLESITITISSTWTCFHKFNNGRKNSRWELQSQWIMEEKQEFPLKITCIEKLWRKLCVWLPLESHMNLSTSTTGEGLSLTYFISQNIASAIFPIHQKFTWSIFLQTVSQSSDHWVRLEVSQKVLPLFLCPPASHLFLSPPFYPQRREGDLK